LGHGVEIWLCTVHADTEFQTVRDGRVFADALSRLWAAHGCLTEARRKALAAHLKACDPGGHPRKRPGSYAWADLRRKVEVAFANGVRPAAVHAHLKRSSQPGPANGPSLRTLMRWHAERRWIVAG
jgi:hypothetical protein